MKKLLLLSVLILTFINANAQDIIDSSAKEICTCANEKIKSIDNAGSVQKETFLFICTTSVFNKNKPAVIKEYGLEVFNQDGIFERFTKDVNEKLANICPNILPNLPQQIATPKIENNAKSVAEIVPIVCTVLSISNNQYPTIEARDNKGEIHTFIIFRPFPSDSLFTMGGIKIGNTIKVTYNLEDILLENTTDFKTLKVITQLEKIK